MRAIELNIHLLYWLGDGGSLREGRGYAERDKEVEGEKGAVGFAFVLM